MSEEMVTFAIGIGYVVFFIFWLIIYLKLIEPRLLNWLSHQLGLKIKRKGRSWRILNTEHTWQQGCLVGILEIVLSIVIFTMPFWGFIVLAVAVSLLLSGSR